MHKISMRLHLKKGRTNMKKMEKVCGDQKVALTVCLSIAPTTVFGPMGGIKSMYEHSFSYIRTNRSN